MSNNQQGLKHSTSFNDPNLERSVAQQSHSSPGSLSQEQWQQQQRNYKESVREYGPPKQNTSHPSLFLFGRDEFERSEIVERNFQNQFDSPVTPENTPIYPVKLDHRKDHGASVPDFLHHQHHQKPHENRPIKNTWPYGLSNENMYSNNGQLLHNHHNQSLAKYATLPKQPYFGQEEWSNKRMDKTSDPNLNQAAQNEWPVNRRSSGSWPAIAGTPRMRYIYAYPEEVPAWIQQHNTQKPPVPAHRHGHDMHQHQAKSPPIRKLSAPEHRAHRSMIAELKAKFQALNGNEEEGDNNEKEPMNKSPRHSPLHTIPADPPPIPPSHRQKRLSSNEREAKNSLGDIQQILQSNDSHVLPVVERYLKSNFNQGDSHKTLDLTEFHESEVPLQHYWERVFRVSDGKKKATIKIENLLTIESGDSPNNFSPLFTRATAKMPDEGIKPQPKPHQTPESPLLSSEEAVSWYKNDNNNTYATVMSSSTKPTKTTTIRSESDLLAMVHRKLDKGVPLEWPELFLIKNSHCRWVIGKEREFRRLSNEPRHERVWRQISADLTHSYLQYQEILERARVIDDLYTDLAHSIMKAESFWYGARICADRSLRTSWYRSSIHLYKQLLTKARECLPPNDRSLLTILDKLAMIMLESCQADPVTVQLCRSAIGAAEQALDLEINLKIERKLIKIKNNLVRIESNILRQS